MKMKTTLALILVMLISLSGLTLKAQQDQPVHPKIIRTGVFLGETPPLRDLPALTPAQLEELYKKRREKGKELNEGLNVRSYPFASTALPVGPDPALQSAMGSKSPMSSAPIQNFSGQSSSSFPPDCNAAVGPNHVMQTVNVTYAIYNKTGGLLAGPTNLNTLFSGTTGSSYNDGDPVVLYDEQAQRFLVAEFSISGSNDYMLLAVSTTSDPTGTWYKWSFDVADTPDYPKFGVWQDGYYMADNNASGNDIYVFQRSVMLTGGASPQMIGFDNPNRPNSIDGFMCVPPVDNDGTFAPAGAPGIFLAFNDDAISGGSDQLWIYELAANWTTPASSTFSRVQQLAVTAFDSNFGNNWNNITQQGTTQKLDAIPQVIMNVPQYRNFGTYQAMVCCHTVDVDATNHAGVRWYELRRGTQTSGNWTIRQQGTYSPDAHSRWMGSIMLNGSGKLGLGYSISSSTLYPGIRYTGQSASAYASATGVMDIAEQTIQTGTTYQSSINRWGDYASMSVDPSDDATFWFTTEYMLSTSSHGTKIASFKLGSDPTVTTAAATAITTTTATLNGTVNPNGLATTYYFQYGLTTSYGSTTTSTSAGSGTSAVSVNAGITSLVAGSTYHFRLVATNSDGTAYGSDLTFTALAVLPTVSTTAVTSITFNSAVSGGNVTADGGATVTARGVCWSTSSGPVATGNHTTNGTGTGTFTSNITGLSGNTLYYVRAYATNSAGTAYGSELQFTTTATPTLSVTPSNQNTTASAGSVNFTVTSNSAWTAASDQSWCTVTASGTGNGALVATVAANASVSQRVANVTVTVTGITPIVVTVTQAGTNPTLSVTPSNQNVAATSGATSFTVTSNATWSVVSDQSWCSVTPSGSGNGTLTATFTNNTTINSRVANITVTVAGLSPISVTVTQDGIVPTLSVTPSNQNVASSAGTTSFTITTNASWTASSDQAWCTPTASGTGSGTISASYTDNTTYVSRVANITVTVAGLSPVIVTVTQAGATPPEFLYTIANDVQTSETTFEFDLLLLDNDATTPFELATVQAGILMNSAVYNGGTITASIVPGTSTLNTSQQPASITYTQSANIIKLAAKAPPGAGNGTILSTNPASPTRICRIKMTNSVPWAQAQPNLAFCFVNPPYPTKISQYINGINTAMTVNTTNCYSVCANNLLNPPPVLSVSPSNQTVTSAAGSTPFAVSSNATWTAVSDQSWCTVTPTGYANGTITATYTANAGASARIANITVTVTGLSPFVVTVTQNGPANKTLNLNLFLESLYNSNGVMRQAMDDVGPHWGAGIADKITVELHSSSNYSTLSYSVSNADLMTDGTCSVTLPSAVNGTYYITIRHRNSIETVSATAVSFAGSVISYSFDNAAMVFGANVLQKPDGHYVIYGGDPNQDGLIDSGDMIIIDNAASNFATGYIVSDINGDGLVDSGDMIILDNNASNFVASVTP